MVRKITYTKHALLRMERRNIDAKDVERVLFGEHETFVNTMHNVFIAVRRDPPLVIVYRLHGREEIRVITVFFPKNINRLVERRTSKGRWQQ